MNTFSVVQIMTASIAPVIVISGVGLLLLSISNRYGRAIDRVRLLARELSESDPESARRRHLTEQLRLTNHRAHILKRSMLYASVCIFFVSLTILSLFAEQLIGLQKDFWRCRFLPCAWYVWWCRCIFRYATSRCRWRRWSWRSATGCAGICICRSAAGLKSDKELVRNSKV